MTPVSGTRRVRLGNPVPGPVVTSRSKTPARFYVVLRTTLTSPGMPYVVGELAEPGMAWNPRGTGAEVLGREKMAGDRQLARALAAWEAGDDRLRTGEGEAVRRLVHAALAVGGRIAAAVASILPAAGMASEDVSP